MIRNLFLFIFSFFCSAIIAQNFPDNATGLWKGSMDLYNAKGKFMTVSMQLHILPADSGTYTWTMIYGDSAKDVRPYILRPADKEKGHWIVDEKNGILIDGYYRGNVFITTFSTMGTMLTMTFGFENDRMIVQVFSHEEKPVKSTGLGTEESPTVMIYQVSGYQRGELMRK